MVLKQDYVYEPSFVIIEMKPWNIKVYGDKIKIYIRPKEDYVTHNNKVSFQDYIRATYYFRKQS